MRVSFRVSGGVTGLRRGVDLDTSSLTRREGQELLRLVERSGIQGRREAVSEPARDLPLYEIRILRSDDAASLVCDETGVPPAARPLLAYLAARAVALAPPPEAPGSAREP